MGTDRWPIDKDVNRLEWSRCWLRQGFDRLSPIVEHCHCGPSLNSGSRSWALSWSREDAGLFIVAGRPAAR
jgi:hypothetical protein